jgi:hypothetical protein
VYVPIVFICFTKRHNTHFAGVILQKMQNIINYYTEYRKTHYVDNIGIAIENQRREEERNKIRRELLKLKAVRNTEKYVLLQDEKLTIYKQIEMCYDDVTGEQNDMLFETLCKRIETIESRQLELIKSEGVNVQLCEDNNINVITRLL